MNTAIFIISVFGIASLILGLGLSRERRNSEQKEEQRVTKIVVIVGLMFCLLWLITGLIIIKCKIFIN